MKTQEKRTKRYWLLQSIIADSGRFRFGQHMAVIDPSTVSSLLPIDIWKTKVEVTKPFILQEAFALPKMIVPTGSYSIVHVLRFAAFRLVQRPVLSNADERHHVWFERQLRRHGYIKTEPWSTYEDYVTHTHYNVEDELWYAVVWVRGRTRKGDVSPAFSNGYERSDTAVFHAMVLIVNELLKLDGYLLRRHLGSDEISSSLPSEETRDELIRSIQDNSSDWAEKRAYNYGCNAGAITQESQDRDFDDFETTLWNHSTFANDVNADGQSITLRAYWRVLSRFELLSRMALQPPEHVIRSVYNFD
jgi:hypothetical protein